MQGFYSAFFLHVFDSSLIFSWKMTQLDPIIAVADVAASAAWYQKIFGFRNAHGGEDFAVLMDETDQIILCLHQWAAHEHPTLKDRSIAVGNGLLLYFRTSNMEAIKSNLEKENWLLEEALHLNPNSQRMEFSLKDPNGYFLTVTEYHRYEG